MTDQELENIMKNRREPEVSPWLTDRIINASLTPASKNELSVWSLLFSTKLTVVAVCLMLLGLVAGYILDNQQEELMFTQSKDVTWSDYFAYNGRIYE
ncbi:MAG: hypothetical protein AAF984_05320 [Verrucomicrobiota bacterium]